MTYSLNPFYTKDNSDAAMNYIRNIRAVNFDDPEYTPDGFI